MKFSVGVTLVGLFVASASAAVPTQMAHQGVVAVNGIRFPGPTGTFYFALVANGGAGNNLWTNDGTELGTTNRPTAGVTISVADGVYSANLGGGTMTPIQSSVFNNGDVVLRLWFDDGSNGVQLLTPDQAMSSSPQSMNCERLGGQTSAELVPPGTVVSFAGSAAPPGWLLCDGSAVSRSTYANLFSAIGISWGSGDGSSTFHLPDLRGRFLRGRDGGSGRDPDAGTRTSSNAGGATGDAVGSVQDDAFQGHAHEMNHGSLMAFTWTGGSFDMVGGGPHNMFSDWSVTNAREDGIHGPVRVSNETRTKNANVNYIIKH